jgi:hypothetical protein
MEVYSRMERLDREFQSLLSHYNFEYLETYSGVIYGVWKNFRLAYLNPEWYRFAKENGGEPVISTKWGLGRSILDCVSGDVKRFYAANLKACLTSHTIWSHDYDGSSGAIGRCYHQIVYPLLDQEGLLIVNSSVVEGLHDPKRRPARTAVEGIYLDKNGFYCQCAYCRRVKNFHETERWDWVPAWVKRYPENTSHTFCPSCFAHYFSMASTYKRK